VNKIKEHYISVWKYYKETPCTLIYAIKKKDRLTKKNAILSKLFYDFNIWNSKISPVSILFNLLLIQFMIITNYLNVDIL
jgi:hypothetical protein